MALTTVRDILKNHETVVLGSAPLSEEAGNVLASSNFTRLICVNGSIGITERIPDIFVLNSREYDDPIYLNPTRWTAERKQLHEIMMAQAVGKSTRHIVFLLKNDRPDQTIARLHASNTKWRAYTTLNTGQKTDLVRKAGVYRYTTAFNISAGLFGACLALANKAQHVTLIGFSFKDGHSYLPNAVNNRFHLEQDQEAIQDLARVHNSRFHIVY